MPCNATTNRGYSGVNVVLLWCTAQERGYSAPRWLTFKQAIEAGGNVRRGEKGSTVVYVSTFDKADDAGELQRIPFLKAFTVFNVAQCENLPAEIGGDRALRPSGRARNELADDFMRATGAQTQEGQGRAAYSRKADRVLLPAFDAYSSADAFYGDAFHELTHWTGAKHRLDRDMGKRFGDKGYSAEELVAELGSAFLCAEFGFDNEGQDAAYIAHWIGFLENHERAFVAAASAASKAAEYMRALALAEPAPMQIAA
jgi:antirestriction protein ArdC